MNVGKISGGVSEESARGGTVQRLTSTSLWRLTCEETPSYYGDAPQSKEAAIAQVLGGFKTVAIDRQTEMLARGRDLRRDIAGIADEIQRIARNKSLSPRSPFFMSFAPGCKK